MDDFKVSFMILTSLINIHEDFTKADTKLCQRGMEIHSCASGRRKFLFLKNGGFKFNTNTS